MTNTFSHQPPDSIANHSRADGSRDPKTDREAATGLGQPCHKAANWSTRKHRPLCENSGKRPVSTKGLPDRLAGRQGREVASTARLAFVAHAQLPTAFGSSTADDFPSVLCCHPGTKAVRVASLAFVRLKCSFHFLLGRSILLQVFQGTHFQPHLQPPSSGASRTDFSLSVPSVPFVIFSLAFRISHEYNWCPLWAGSGCG